METIWTICLVVGIFACLALGATFYSHYLSVKEDRKKKVVGTYKGYKKVELIIAIILIICIIGFIIAYSNYTPTYSSTSSSSSSKCTSCGKNTATIGTICDDCLNRAKGAFYAS
ncbi:MAG: hypothetical protein IJD64_04565 [Clostridia bacterium]|nr:hypothetical protein [Clostridia bacterium]